MSENHFNYDPMRVPSSSHYLLGIIFLFISGMGFSQTAQFTLTDPFYPNSQTLQQDSIVYGYLKVPEVWDTPGSDSLEIAVAIIKNTSGHKHADAVVYIQGGPGAGGIQNIWRWRRHLVKKDKDIVLFDMRGTGFSKPRLCPELGGKLLEILAKDQRKDIEEMEKVAAATQCQQDLLNRGVHIQDYQSGAVARDLHALKSALGYATWNVYGVSYGTYVAQVYAASFPQDVVTLTLDSFIADISNYYTQNTSHYMQALEKVFSQCEGDDACSNSYPDLEQTFYQTIAMLEENPITVKVNKSVVPAGEFTYNAEDFKVAIQQALYNKQLVEIVPLLIYEFKNRNEEALGNLVPAFSSLLSMDYGVYFCVTCNEVIPHNQFSRYQTDAAQFTGLQGGISFYQSDFGVCAEWNRQRPDTTIMQYDLKKVHAGEFPLLLFYGEYDPITPGNTRKKLLHDFHNAYVVPGYTYGHVPGLTNTGFKVGAGFINNPQAPPDSLAFQDEEKVLFAAGVKVNPGVSKFGNSVSKMDVLFMTPLIISILLMIVFVFFFTIKIIRRRYVYLPDRIVRVFAMLASITGVLGLVLLMMALNTVLKQNQFVLAFGLPAQFSYIFFIFYLFAFLVMLMLLYFFAQFRRIKNRTVVFSVIFSNIVLVVYLFYWSIL